MSRYDLTDRQWEIIAPLLPQKSLRGGRPWKDHRTMINGMLWIANSGCRWRELPERYGPWQSVYDRYSNWRTVGLWDQILLNLLTRLDPIERNNWESAFIESMEQESGG